MISCSEYDYIEIVCLYRYPIRLTMKAGEAVEGVALDTLRNEQRNECIKVDVGEDGQLIELSEILKLEVLIENPHFTEITFQ